MHAFFRVVTFVSLLAILPLVLSIPIPAWSSTVVNKPAVNDAASQARVAAYHEADATAKDMVDKMVKVANSNKPEHQKIVNDAFGPNADRNKIKATIHNLNTKPVQVGTTDIAGVRAGLVASTPITRPNGPGGPIKLGPEFFAGSSSKEYRAGTLIHEATHQQSYTGDFINKDHKIVGALESQKENIKMQEDGKPHIGYHFPGPPDVKKVPKTAADLSDKYKNNRDHVVSNMHDNADSYRVFAHLCSQPGVARRDIELFSRALMEADDDEHVYLSKRSSCALPKDYFKNKAAAKAGTAGKGTKSPEPSSHLTKGATKQTSPGRTSQRVASGVKSHVSTKSKGPTSHLAKGASMKTSRVSPSKAANKSFVKPKGASTRTASRVSPKAVNKPVVKAQGASIKTSRVSSKAANKPVVKAQGASIRTSRVSSKAANKSVIKAQGASMRTSRAPPKAAPKPVVSASKGPAVQGKVSGVAKKVAAGLLKAGKK